MSTIDFEDFMKLDIRVGRVVSAEKVDGTDKLIKLTVDTGDGERSLVAGIADRYEPEELEGRLIPVLVNLEPRKIKGIESNGMILAADLQGSAVLLNPDGDVPPGSRIR